MRPDKKKNRGRGRGHPAPAQAPVQNDVVPVGQSSAVPAVLNQEQPQAVKNPNEANQPVANATKEASVEIEEQSSRKNFSKREIFTNWEQWQRFDEREREVNEEEEEDSGLDFQKLMQAPMSAEGHFFFKSEKLEAPPSTGNLFALDLKALSDGLKTIPFYKQLDLPTSYFSESAIKSMDQEAATTIQQLPDPTTKLLAILQDNPSQPAKPLDQNSKSIPKVENNIIEKILTPAVDNIKISACANIPLPSPSIVSQPPASIPTTICDEAKNENTPVSLAVENIISKPPRVQRERKTKKAEPVSPPATHVAIKEVQVPPPITTEQFLDSIDVEPESPANVSQSSVASPAVNSQDNNDLEAWLDSVLDD